MKQIPNSSRELVATSGPLDRLIGIVVCIPSFRRPHHLRLTLQSLADQRTGRRFAVVIVENDAAGREAVPVAIEFLWAGKIPGHCVVEPRQGNCHAINAAFETALANFPAATKLLMIDDDEIASPQWLEAMVNAAEETRADGCGNCLITRPVFSKLADPAFDLKFNFLGGGDTDFFVRCRQAGMKFHWSADAVITETVPQSRTHPGWLVLRGLRIGAINYHIELKAARTLSSRAKLFAKMFAMLPLSLFRAGRLVVTEQKPIIALHPMTVAVGSALAAIGIEPQPYKASKITR
jgi:GT2 family glycosyltransferase